MAKYNVGDKINFLEFEYELKEYSDESGYFWKYIYDEYSNSIIFETINLDSNNFSKKVLNYSESGGFPLMYTLEDVEKLTDALLLECAKFRYPKGTKFKRAHALNNNMPIIESTGKFNFEIPCICIRMVDEYSNFLNDSVKYSATCYYKGNWAEVVTEEKDKTKFEVGKWYELKYTFRDKLCNTLLKSTTDSFDKVYFDRYYDLEEECWREAISFSIDSSIKIIYVQERSLEEIQQYLPDGHPDKISKQFVLPERWHVVVTEENKEVLSKWRFKGSNNKLSVGKITGICDHKKNPEHNPIGKIKSDNYDFGVEITFEQFKKHVLKENIKSSEPTKPNFDNCKIWIGDNPELSKKVQEKLFKLGYSWRGGDETIQMCEAYCLFTHPDKDITHQQKDRVYFIKQGKREIFPSDLGITVEEEYKVGDWIIFTDLETNYREHNGDIVQITDINPDRVHTSWINHTPESFSGGGFALDAYKKCFRKARPEEIPDYNPLNDLEVKEGKIQLKEQTVCGNTGMFPRIPRLHELSPSLCMNYSSEWMYNQKLTGMPIYFGGIDPVSEPKTTLSIDDDELPMVRPREEVKVTKQLSID